METDGKMQGPAAPRVTFSNGSRACQRKCEFECPCQPCWRALKAAERLAACEPVAFDREPADSPTTHQDYSVSSESSIVP